MNYKLFRKVSLIAVILTCVLVAIPVTTAFFRTEDTIANEFTLDTVAIEVVEEFTPPTDWDGSKATKKVQVQNNGSEATLIRVGLTPYWQQKIGTTEPSEYIPFAGDNSLVKLTFPNLTTVANATGEPESGKWFLATDGYYYYNQLVAPGEQTTLLISDVTIDFSQLNSGDQERYKQAEFLLDVDAQAVHAYSNAVTDVWGSLGSDVKPLIEALIAKVN